GQGIRICVRSLAVLPTDVGDATCPAMMLMEGGSPGSVWITISTPSTREALMPHRNAPLTETGRLRLARCVVEDGRPVRRAAERFRVSPPTTAGWAARYRQYGPAGMVDRSSRRAAAQISCHGEPSGGSSACASREGSAQPGSPSGSG